MVLNKIRFVIACVLGLFPFIVFLTIHAKMSSIYKLIKKYKFIDWLDTRIIHISSLSLELFMRMIDLNVYMLGDDRSKWIHDPTLILSNHCNEFDSLLLALISFNNLERLFFYHSQVKRASWLTKLYTGRDQYFEKKDGTDNAQNFEQHLKKHFFPMYLFCVLYPEGGIYRKVAKKSEEYAKANNIPSFKHLALPYIKGIKAALNALVPAEVETSRNQQGQPQRLKWVADKTFLYSDDSILPENLFQGVMKKKTEIYIHTKIYNIEEVPRDLEQLKKWIHERFSEKDMILENYKAHGKLPTDKKSQQSLFAIDFILFQSLYLLSLYNFIISPCMSLVMKCF